jgi:hypothetical protein
VRGVAWEDVGIFTDGGCCAKLDYFLSSESRVTER